MNSTQPVTVRPGAKKNDSLAQEKKHWAINRPCLPPLSHCRTQDAAKPIRLLPAPASGPHLPPPARADDAPDAHVPTYRKRNHYLLGTFFHRRRQSISTSSLPPASFPSRSSYLLTLPVRCCRCLFLPILLPPTRKPISFIIEQRQTGKTQPYRRRRFQPRLVSETISRLGRSLVFLSRLYSLSLSLRLVPFRNSPSAPPVVPRGRSSLSLASPPSRTTSRLLENAKQAPPLPTRPAFDFLARFLVFRLPYSNDSRRQSLRPHFRARPDRRQQAPCAPLRPPNDNDA